MGDRSPTSLSTWLVVTVLVATALAAPASSSTGLQASQTAAGTENGAASQLGSACDYADVYDGAIGSVVGVSRAGGSGSGFVYDAPDADGTSYVLTNQHVVGEADTVTVRFRRGEYTTGTVVGRDAYADLAVVRVDSPPDYAEALRVSESVPVPGSGVAAIGSPFGLRGSVTQGIVSGVNRSMPTERGYSVPDVVQTDAPINPGNSGGPLLSCEGEVVGVNTAGIQAAVADNVGFAVSSTMIRRVAPALIEEGEIDWPYLGIRSTGVTPAVAAANDLELARGVAVVETVEGGPADGVLHPSEAVRTENGQPVPVGGDVIVAIDGHRVDTIEDLSSYLATDAAPGQTVSITVVRDGDRRQVTVTLDERPGPEAPGGS